MNNDDYITATMDAERKWWTENSFRAIWESRAWVCFDGTRWLAMRIGNLALTGAGATVEEAIEALRAQEVQK